METPLKLSDFETVYQENKDFVKTVINGRSGEYIQVKIPGDKDLHFYFNYGSLIYKGEFYLLNMSFEPICNMLTAFYFYYTEMHAL